MELWFSEMHTDNVKLSVRINRQLFSGESEYQRIDVFDSEDLGKFIALDGEIVFSDQDEFIYDEMVAHVPMAVHPNVKKVLIIGGGDGGVAGELLRYPGQEPHQREGVCILRGRPAVSAAENGCVRPDHQRFHGSLRLHGGAVHQGILRQLL